jgi:hypothetical protein
MKMRRIERLKTCLRIGFTEPVIFSALDSKTFHIIHLTEIPLVHRAKCTQELIY